ncbi:MAG: hypothetical protein KAX77_01265 [Xanthomonadales bacterium]|nr:hypothetical protein [Xanthomonadales bacterium]
MIVGYIAIGAVALLACILTILARPDLFDRIVDAMFGPESPPEPHDDGTADRSDPP